MNTLVKVEAVLTGAAVAGFVVLAAVGRTLQARGSVRDPAALGRTLLPIILALFLVFGLAVMGLALHVFLVLQVRIGNGDLAPIAFLRRSETAVTVGVWAFLILGTAVAFPAMRREMLGNRPTVGPSKGILRANIGMTLDEVRAASTLTIRSATTIVPNNSSQTAGDEVFDFEIAGSSVRFEKCRYFFITTGPKNDPRIDSMNIGISPFKKPRAQINADEAEVRRQLSADGWTPGRLVSRTEKDPSLIAGVPTSGEERYWSKAQTLLTLSSRRMDDAKPGEDARTAGEFILFIDLAPHARLERGPTAPDAGASAASGGSP